MVNTGLESIGSGQGSNVRDPIDRAAASAASAHGHVAEQRRRRQRQQQQQQQQQQQPHAVLFPYPIQGHINPMMHLARKLLADDFFVTFVNTDYNHHRMFSSANNNNHNNHDNNNLLVNPPPNLRFVHLPDGLPESHGRFNENVIEATAAILALPRPLTDLIKGLNHGSCSRTDQDDDEDREVLRSMHRPDTSSAPPVTCIVADSLCSGLQDVADELGVPRVTLWTTPAHANLAYHFMSLLIDRGYVPLVAADKRKMFSEVVTCVPGIVPMKLQDHISFFLVSDIDDVLFQGLLRLFVRRANDAAWNLGNTWAELDAAADGAFTSAVPSYVAVGPLLPDSLLAPTTTTMTTTTASAAYRATLMPAAASSLLAEDGSCLDWLSAHEAGTVLYISFGSIAQIAEGELKGLVEGIRKSGVPFLWAVRPDQGGKVLDSLRAELVSSSPQLAGQVGRLVAWVPQLAVLAHPAVGGILTHCGWNSVLESIAAGVPMLARAGGLAEQRMNAHYIARVWKVGLRMHEGAGADEVARLIRALMVPDDDAIDSSSVAEGRVVRLRLAEVRRSAADAAVGDNGSSAGNYRRFIADMRQRAAASAAAGRVRGAM